MTISSLKKELNSLKNPAKVKIFKRFFKTGKGEYGEGDVFLGLTVPQQRKIANKYLHLNLSDLKKILQSKIHEYRLTSLFILMDKFKKARRHPGGTPLISGGIDRISLKSTGDSPRINAGASLQNDRQKQIFNFYLQNTKYINNWDLIDISAPKIIGDYLLDKPAERKILYKLAKSKNLWQRRIGIMATFAFIKKRDFKDTLKIAKILLQDSHDLIHKAVGWMLRELGKKDQVLEESFLKKHYKTMPRTMLRYSIEKFSDKKRKFYLRKTA